MLKFQPFTPQVDASFWQELARKKLHELKLDESPVPIWALYRPAPRTNVPSQFSLRRESFQGPASLATSKDVIFPGLLINKNTVEGFKAVDKQKLLNSAGDEVLRNFPTVAENPAQLCQFILLTYADLKAQKFVYWFAHPVLVPTQPFTLTSAPTMLSSVIPSDQSAALLSSVDAFAKACVSRGSGIPPFFAVDSRTMQAMSLVDGVEKGVMVSDETWFGFIDPCPLPDYPGWPIRNFLVYLAEVFKRPSARILAFRTLQFDASVSADAGSQCVVFDVDLSPYISSLRTDTVASDVDDDAAVGSQFTVVGWSMNANGSLAPDVVSLKSIMDPTTIAENAVNLNVNLMRWRVLPDLNATMLASTKFLLVGAGTLGCNVSRALMGWGVRHITFIDNGKVSYSNPVRQSLFELSDCVDGGQFKAIAASKALSRIFPGMTSSGHVLNIPMPGHPITSSTEIEGVRTDISKLSTLIAEHDVIFLLTDTRESRWLPTLLCNDMNKLVINVALGFDSYLIIRHGGAPVTEPTTPTVVSGGDGDGGMSISRLGCYYCNDVVAPGNSTKDRTLDQQCTVTRPGIAMIASAMSVELCVGLLHHPLQGGAPADDNSGVTSTTTSTTSPFGLLPHQIRGFLATYNQILAASRAFQHCPGCGDAVLSAYRARGFDFLLEVFNDPTYLEKASGLQAYHEATDSLLSTWDGDEDDEVDVDGDDDDHE